MSKTATCGTSGSAARASSIAASAGALWSGASSVSAIELAASTPSSISDRLAKARAAVHDPVGDRADDRAAPRSSDATVADESSSSDDGELEARRAGVDDEDAQPQYGHVQSRDLRVVLPVLARVRAGAQARVVHLLPQRAGRVGEPGHTVDHVDHEVEAVEVVQHHHVERRRRRALLLVAAHVEVVVVRAAVGEPVDQPGIAVVGEDDRRSS